MAVFTVDTLEDTVADDGMTSLREALVLSAANGTFDDDDIVFAPGLSGTIRLVQGTLDVQSKVQIVGDGRITITGDANGDDVTRADGTTDILASHDQGLLNDNVRVFGAFAVRDFAVRELTITGGFYSNTLGGGGGAIATYGSLTVQDSAIIGNGAETLGDVRVEGGAIEVRPTVPGSGTPSYFQLLSSTVSGNLAIGINTNGGAIAAADAFVSGSTISDNTVMGARSSGGGIWAYRLEMVNSTVSGNRILGSGEIFNSRGGGVYARTDSTITSSTIADNFVQEGRGGGLFLVAEATLSNVTVAGNFAGYVSPVPGVSIARAVGGGVYADETVTILNSTITGNQTYGHANYASAGGLFAYTGADIGNSIIAGNVTNGGNPGFNEISIFFNGPGAVNQIGPNILSGGVFAAFDQVAEILFDTDFDGVGDTPSGVFGGVLDDNGGNVETVALDGALSNPALDAGLNALTNQGDDARGGFYDRIVDLAGVTPVLDNAIDLGAYEYSGLSYAEAMRVAYTYEAGLDRDGNIDLEGLNFWIDVREGQIGDGITELELAGFFLNSDEFQALVETFLGGGADITDANVRDPAAFSDDDYVIFLYENVLDRAFDQPGFDFWSGVLDDLLASPATAPTAREALLLFFADSPENHGNSPIVETLEEVTLGDWAFV